MWKQLAEIIICPGFNTVKISGTKPTSLKPKIANIYKNNNFWKAVSENWPRNSDRFVKKKNI